MLQWGARELLLPSRHPRHVCGMLWAVVGVVATVGVMAAFSCPMIMETSGQVERRLLNEGFHRELETTVLLSSSESLESCDVLLKETFPPGCYIDPHQMAFLRALGGPDFFVPQVINVEAPEHLSPRIVAYFFMHTQALADGRWLANTTVPMHLRYHRAWSGQEHPPLEASVHVPHPTVMLHCEEGMTEDCSRLVQLEPCPPAGPHLCQWLPVHTFSTSEGVVAAVPVGNTDLLDTVLLTTTCLTAAATLLILAALAKKMPPSLPPPPPSFIPPTLQS